MTDDEQKRTADAYRAGVEAMRVACVKAAEAERAEWFEMGHYQAAAAVKIVRLIIAALPLPIEEGTS